MGDTERMPGPEIKASTTDQLRLQNYRTQIQNKNQADLRAMEDRHSDEIERKLEAQARQKETLQEAYNVEISREAESLEERLQQIRLTNERLVAEEKRSGEMELDKLRKSNQQRIQEYKKNSEAQMEALRKELQASTDYVRNQARKSAKRNTEVSES